MKKYLFLAAMLLFSAPLLAEEPKDALKNLGDTLGDFELCPVPKGQYWFDPDNRIYNYNQYAIDVDCEPAMARVEINGQYVGTAPGTCLFTGKHREDEFVTVKVIPIDPGYKGSKKVFKGTKPLPAEIGFKVERN
jgi:hypothetical protein